MFSMIPIEIDHVIGIRAEGTLTDEDYQKFLPELEKIINSNTQLSVYIDMTDFKGWQAKAAWDDFKFGTAHDADFERIAVIGTASWQKWMIRVSNIFFSADMRFFDADAKQQALDWLAEERAKETLQGKEMVLRSYSHILLATDFSPHAELAARRAQELSLRYSAKLSLIHVLDNMIPYDEFTEPIVIDQVGLYQELEKSSQELLDNLAKRLEISDSADIRLLHGNPKHQLLDFARQYDVDLIVLGSHGRKGVERLLGSVAANVVKKADCDVLTVHL